MKILAEKDPAALPWKDLGIDVVVESTVSLRITPRQALTLPLAPSASSLLLRQRMGTEPSLARPS